jgi:hypothetical protein
LYMYFFFFNFKWFFIFLLVKDGELWLITILHFEVFHHLCPTIHDYFVPSSPEIEYRNVNRYETNEAISTRNYSTL